MNKGKCEDCGGYFDFEDMFEYIRGIFLCENCYYSSGGDNAQD